MFWNDLNFFAFIHFVIGVISIVLGIAVFFKSTKNDVNRIFGLFSLGVAVWSFSYAIWLLSKSHDAALFWSRTLNLGATFIPVLYFHWVITVIKKDKKKLLIVYYFITFLFAFFSYSDIYIKGVKPILAFPYWPQANWLYILFLLFGWCNIFLYGLFLLIKELKNSTGSYHEQIKYVLFGSSIGLVGGSTNFFLMLGADWVHPIGSSLVVAYPLIFSYTIVKHRLMDIKVFAAQLFIIALNLIAFVYIFVSDSAREYVVKIIFFIGTLFISFLLYKSFNKEVQRKEELQKLSDKLEDANEQLKKLDRAKSEFISIASHQLRTPLTAIKGYVSLIIEGTYGKIDKKIKEALSKVYVSNERLIQLVENLLNISRIESGKIEYKYDNWQIEKIIKELTDNFIFAAKKKKLYLHLDLPKHPLPMIRIDGNKVKEVISNVIDNAIKYTNEGGATIKAEETKDKIRVTVSDTGIGIPKDETSYVFTKFSRGHDTSRLQASGTGLGMYVGKSLIEAQNGKIWCESKGDGRGSKFIIELPINPHTHEDTAKTFK